MKSERFMCQGGVERVGSRRWSKKVWFVRVGLAVLLLLAMGLASEKMLFSWAAEVDSE